MNSFPEIEEMSANLVCPTPALPFDPTKGISTTTFTPDTTTGRVPAAQIESYITTLRSKGLLPSSSSSTMYAHSPGTLSGQINTDAHIFTAIQAEYCYYQDQYKQALSEYLTNATSNTAASTTINNVTQLNLRLNSLIEIMNSLSQERAKNVQSNKDSINKWNADISKKLSGLQDQFNRIQRDDKTILTQTKMMEFSKEKNNAISNQIGLYIALNIAAIGMIFFVSRSL
jgi:transcriptional regulator of acetoin/glycerol metabolism